MARVGIDEEDMERLYQVVFGNGKPGLDEQMRVNTAGIEAVNRSLLALSEKIDARLAEMRSAVDKLVLREHEEKARRDGSRAALNWIKWVLSVLVALVTIGGTLGMLKLSADWNQVQQQIQRIPSLPE